MLLRHTLRASIFSLLILQATTGALSADTTTHTFADGATLNYALPEGTAELSKTPVTISVAKFEIPYIGEVSLKGNGTLSKDTTNQYILTVTPNAALENNSLLKLWPLLKASEKGTLVVQLSDAGETIQATDFVIEQEVSLITGEKLDYSHTYKKVEGSEELYANTTKLLITNGETKSLEKAPSEPSLESLVNNPFSQFKELLVDFSYVSGKDYGDFKKDLKANYHAKGHKGFILNGNIDSGFPFAKTPGGENIPGYTFTVSMPVIEFKPETEEEKAALLDVLKRNITVYEHMLTQYQNSFTDSILASVKKHKDVIVERSYQYFSQLTKEDKSSLFLTLMTAKQETNSPADRSFADLDLSIRNFKLKVAFAGAEMSQKIVVQMAQPETSIKEMTSFIQSQAFIIEPVLKDLGYLEIVRNFANPEKILPLLRQLSDDPAATGDAPLVITFVSDVGGTKVGTLTNEKAGQLLLGWVLSIVPIK